jgi:putative spermidine/putrescine transport system ATP-binding protein
VPQADRYPNQISGGQAQRAALGRALAPSPDVLLLDEPLSALDALVRTRLRDEIRAVQQRVKITAIYVTHDQAEAMAIADRVAVMNHGRIEQLSQPSTLYEDPSTPFAATFVGGRNAVELSVADGRIALGNAFQLPAPAGATDRAIAFFRPEDVEVAVGGPGASATVELKIYLGATTKLHLAVQTDGEVARLSADLPSRDAARIAQGDTVAVLVDPSHVRAFPLD